MHFVDEATIHVAAGKGGDGCLSFRREKFIARGGPDGGDGGDGGSVYLVGDADLTTLAEFRFRRRHKAKSGQPGMGRQKRGKSGEDLLVPVPIGTMVYDVESGELLGDVLEDQQRLLVAQGGFHGLGNLRFKSSINRAPRQITKGSAGDERELRLELKVLADVGLLGLPNAGKSTLIRAVSNAKPRVANYPFTTLHPHLGVVRVDAWHSFVMADIPGLIEGAAEGTGLGIQFLKHVSRTGLLLHVVDVSVEDPEASVRVIEQEMQRYNDTLLAKPRWLVLNKVDLLPEDQRAGVEERMRQALNWQGEIRVISAIQKQGTKELCQAISLAFDEEKEA